MNAILFGLCMALGIFTIMLVSGLLYKLLGRSEILTDLTAKLNKWILRKKS